MLKIHVISVMLRSYVLILKINESKGQMTEKYTFIETIITSNPNVIEQSEAFYVRKLSKNINKNKSQPF